jgi:hypothetical protein
MARFSMKRIDETWMTYDECIAKKYPGYMLCEKREFIVSKSDVLISMDDLLSLMRSKDIGKYEQTKAHFFGP